MDTVYDVASGKNTARRVAAAEQMAVNPNPKKKVAAPPVASTSVIKPKQKFVDARQRAIDAAAAADRAAIIERNRKLSLRSK